MKLYDVVGIGAGPANLSLAALSEKTNLKTIFLEKRDKFIWHEGMLMPGAKLQVPHLNDLVTLADPTNPYSFLNFLSKHNRLYQFIAANYNPLSRIEFNQYFEWVFNQLKNINKAEEVLQVKYDKKHFQIITSKDTYHSSNLVLGVGHTACIPNIFTDFIGDDVFHNSNFLHKKNNYKGKRVAVIGGGQSGAEIIHHLISDEINLPQELFWISKRSNFSPLDDTPFTNEIFTPSFINYFHGLDKQNREFYIREQKLANQGISECTAKEIYQKLYELKFIKCREEKFNLLPSQNITFISRKDKNYEIHVKDLITQTSKIYVVDKVILCTGYQFKLPSFLANIKHLLNYDNDRLVIDKDYKIDWYGDKESSIYIQNGAEHTHGISDSTLSINAYRSATILNKISDNLVYPNIYDSPIISWKSLLETS